LNYVNGWKFFEQRRLDSGDVVTNYQGPTMLLTFLSVSIVSIFVDLKINIFRPSPSHFATEHQSFRFSVMIFSSSALAGEGKRRAAKFFFQLFLNSRSTVCFLKKKSSGCEQILYLSTALKAPCAVQYW